MRARDCVGRRWIERCEEFCGEDEFCGGEEGTESATESENILAGRPSWILEKH